MNVYILNIYLSATGDMVVNQIELLAFKGLYSGEKDRL
jgi:hypothetical protein